MNTVQKFKKFKEFEVRAKQNAIFQGRDMFGVFDQDYLPFISEFEDLQTPDELFNLFTEYFVFSNREETVQIKIEPQVIAGLHKSFWDGEIIDLVSSDEEDEPREATAYVPTDVLGDQLEPAATVAVSMHVVPHAAEGLVDANTENADGETEMVVEGPTDVAVVQATTAQENSISPTPWPAFNMADIEIPSETSDEGEGQGGGGSILPSTVVTVVAGATPGRRLLNSDDEEHILASEISKRRKRLALLDEDEEGAFEEDDLRKSIGGCYTQRTQISPPSSVHLFDENISEDEEADHFYTAGQQSKHPKRKRKDSSKRGRKPSKATAAVRMPSSIVDSESEEDAPLYIRTPKGTTTSSIATVNATRHPSTQLSSATASPTGDGENDSDSEVDMPNRVRKPRNATKSSVPGRGQSSKAQSSPLTTNTTRLAKPPAAVTTVSFDCQAILEDLQTNHAYDSDDMDTNSEGSDSGESDAEDMDSAAVLATTDTAASTTVLATSTAESGTSSSATVNASAVATTNGTTASATNQSQCGTGASSIAGQSCRPTKIDTLWNRLTPQQQQDMANDQSNCADFAASTLSKVEWCMKLYNSWCNHTGRAAYPITSDNIVCFMEFAMLAGYSASTITQCFCRILKMKARSLFIDKDHWKIRRMVRKVRDLVPTPQKQPVMLVDLARMIRFWNPLDKDKTKKVSLFLTAQCIGARACSMKGIRLKDIQDCSLHEGSAGMFTLRIVLDVEKGKKSGWGKQVRFTGNVPGVSPANTLPSDQDAVFWLSKHLTETFGLDICKAGEWDLRGRENTKLWDFSRGQMRRSLQTAAYNSGYDRFFFTFHGLRCGLLAQALFKAGLDGNKLRDVLQYSAWITGWSPYSKAQLRYLNVLAQGWLDASALINPGVKVKVIDPAINTPEGLHGSDVFTHAPIIHKYGALADIMPKVNEHRSSCCQVSNNDCRRV